MFLTAIFKSLYFKVDRVFSSLHPAAYLSFWLLLAVFLQWASLPLVLFSGLVLLISGIKTRRHWKKLVLRTRLLLLTLFLVFAYGVPGDSPFEFEWLPAFEGMGQAAMHILRLVVFLGSLAWLLALLSSQALMAGLWFLMRPLRFLGIPTDKSVARLSLVLECLENMPLQQWRSWEKWLAFQPSSADESKPVVIVLPRWNKRDSLFLTVSILFMGIWVWQG